MQSARTSQAARRGCRKLLGLLPLLILSGCQSAAGTGAVAGGAGGAVLGNVIAKATGGSRTAGTVLGGALGAVGGAIVGDHVDQNKREAEARGRAQAIAQQNALRAPTLQDIADLSRRGTQDSVIISQIRTTGATYPNLSVEDIKYLQDNAVSSTVIQEMQATSVRGGVVQQRYYAPTPVYMEQPQPVGVGIGVSYSSRH